MVMDSSADVFPGKFNAIGMREMLAVFILSHMVGASYQSFGPGVAHLISSKNQDSSVPMFKEDAGKN